jgi:hypothetical protein
MIVCTSCKNHSLINVKVVEHKRVRACNRCEEII